MTWRRLHFVLFLITVVVALIRISTGNIVGAVFTILLALVFASVAFDFPLIDRLRTIWQLAKRYLWRG